MITQKFTYQKLIRQDTPNGRRYKTPDNQLLPSITTILSKTKDNSHLIEWRNRIGDKKATEITTEAAGIGTRMHNYLEQYILTEEWSNPGSNPYAIQANKMAETIKNNLFDNINEVWGTEVPLYFPKIYAGTTDLVAIYNDKPAIIDFKQANKPKKSEWIEDYYLQLCLYIMAHNEVYNTDIKQGHICMCTRDLEYLQFDILPEDFNYWKNKAWDRVYLYYETFHQ